MSDAELMGDEPGGDEPNDWADTWGELLGDSRAAADVAKCKTVADLIAKLEGIHMRTKRTGRLEMGKPFVPDSYAWDRAKRCGSRGDWVWRLLDCWQANHSETVISLGPCEMQAIWQFCLDGRVPE